MATIISARGLRKSFPSKRGRLQAVAGVNLEVGTGEIVGLLGPNGAGKTTTLRMLTTLLPIEEGEARVAGHDVTTEPAEVRAHIGYVSQLGGADELASGRENLVLQGRLYGGAPDTVERRSREVLDLMDLTELADRRVKTYSGGQRRRLDVALGIVHRPEILVLDEPSTGLDPQNRANLWEHVRDLREAGTTVLLTTHYLEEADALSDRLVIIDHGRVVAEGSPRELKRQVAGDSVVLALHREKPGEASRAEQARAAIAAEPYVREITTEAADSPEGSALRLYVEDGGAALPALLRLLDGMGISLRSMTLSEPTLDDVFLRQTGRSLRDGSSGAGGAPGAEDLGATDTSEGTAA